MARSSVRGAISTVFIAFILLGCAAWTHGGGTTPAAITCNFVTGVATGAAGPCVSPLPSCNGATDIDSSWIAYGTWAQSVQGSTSPFPLIELTIPTGSNCLISGFGAQRPFQGIRNHRLMAYGATITIPSSSGFALGSDGILQDNTSYANFVTSTAGATTLTLVTAGQTSRFTAGGWVAVTGGDLQGFGYPPNPFLFEYAQIQSIGAGTITLTAPLANAYKSTWPNFYPGDGNHAYSGGPGTLYALPAYWDADFDVRGLTVNNTNNGQTASQGRNFSMRDVTCLDVGCVIPSQNKTWSGTNYQASNQQMEVDKMIASLTLTNSTVNRIDIQSMSIQNCVFSSVALTDFMNGTCLTNSFSNATFGDLRVGVTGYGGTTSVSCSTCTFPTLSSVSVADTGTTNSNAGVNKAYSMASGVITVPRQQTVSAAVDNGSGAVRVTVSDTSAWTTGQTAQATCGGGSCGTMVVAGGATSGTWVVTVINATQMDLQGSSSTGSYTANTVTIGTGPIRWAFPGAQMRWSGVTANEASFKVTGVTGDAINTYVATNLAGGFPSIPQSGGKINLNVHPAPVFTCTSCTGSAIATSLSQASAGAPLFSYYKQTFTGATFTDSASSLQNMWGTLVSFNFTVTTPYTGVQAGGVGAWPAVETVVSGTTDQFYAPKYNIKTAGTRTTTPAGVTGTQSGDSALALASATQWFANPLTMQFNPTIVAECISTPLVCPSMTIEVTTDQALVLP